MPKLTKREIDAIPKDAPRQILWDSELKGFGLIVLPSGVRSFLVQYRTSAGRQRRLTLGRYGVLTPDQARKAAQTALAQVTGGGDPLGAEQEHRRALSVSALLDRYLADHVMKHNATKSEANVRALINRHIRPRLGAIQAAAVTRRDIIAMQKALESTPRTANYALAILSKAFNLAELWGVRPEGSNPCSKVPRYRENARERFLSADELARLGRSMEEAESIGLPWRPREGAKSKHLAKEANQRTKVNARVLAALRLLLYTGARLSEILELQWTHIDFERGSIALPERKGGARRSHPVSTAALEIIVALPRVDGSPFVLPAPKNPQAPLSIFVLENGWQRLRARAGLDDVRIHDLRHTVGTYASQTGMNAFGVRDLLRHQSVAITARYANRDADPIRAASEAIGARIAAGLAGASGEVVPLRSKPGK